jgi:hypothetical protein
VKNEVSEPKPDLENNKKDNIIEEKSNSVTDFGQSIAQATSSMI